MISDAIFYKSIGEEIHEIVTVSSIQKTQQQVKMNKKNHDLEGSSIILEFPFLKIRLLFLLSEKTLYLAL